MYRKLIKTFYFLPWWLWFVQPASLIQTTLTADVLGIPLSPHFLSSATLVTGVTYCTLTSVESYAVWVCKSYSYSGLGLGRPCLSSSFAATVLYWSGNLIRHVSLKMQYPPYQHMGLEHFVLAAPAMSLIRFAACSLVLDLNDHLTLPATGLCKNISFFPTLNQPHLPPTILCALQRTQTLLTCKMPFRHT